MYTIKTVTAITGINTETLRAWERRYDAVLPARDNKGRRLYSQEDVDRLSLLANATREGFSIGKISGQSNLELQKILLKNKKEKNNSQSLLFDILQALKDYQLKRCEELLKRALIAMEPLNYAKDLLMPLLIQVGDSWHDGNLSISQEHMFTECVKRIVLNMVNSIQASPSAAAPRIIFATLSGEKHEFGILLSSLVATSHRCNCFYIGVDLPWQELILASEKIQPTIITLSIVNCPPSSQNIQDLKHLANRLPDNIHLWIGGSGSQYLYEQKKLPERFINTTSLDDFNNRLIWLNRN